MRSDPTPSAFGMTKARIVALLLLSALARDVAADSPGRERTDRFGDPLPPGCVARMGTVRWWVGPTEVEHRDCPLVYTPDGKSLAACYEGKAVRFLDAATGKELRRIQPRGDAVTSFALSPDGKRLVTGNSRSPVLHLWSVATGKEIQLLLGDPSGSGSIVFSPDGKLLAVATWSAGLRLWDTATWQQVRRIDEKIEGWRRSLAFLPDGKTLLSGNGAGVTWWDCATGRLIRHLNPATPTWFYEMALSPDGKRLALIDQNNGLSLLDAANGKEIRHVELKRSRGGWCLCFAPDSRTLACGNGIGSRGHETIFFAADTGRELRRWDEADRLTTQMAFSPDGKILAQVRSGVLRLRDIATGQPCQRIPGLPGPVTAVRFTRAGKALTVSCLGGRTGVMEPLTGEPLASFQEPPRELSHLLDLVPETVLTRDGRKAALVDVKRVLHVWETASGKACCRIDDPKPCADRAVFTADGKLLAIGHQDNTLRLWNTTTGELLRSIDLPLRHYPCVLAFSPDGRLLASYPARPFRDDTIHLWDTATGEAWGQLPWPERTAPSSLLFTADGKRLIVSYDAGLPERAARERVGVCVWDLTTRRELRRIRGAAGEIALSPDEKTLAAVDGRTTRLWELASGKERGRFAGHREDIRSLAFAPDGRLLASGSQDYTACVWDVTGICPDGKWSFQRGATDELQRLWEDLGDRDGERAYRAVWKFAVAGPDAVTFLTQRLRPTPRVDEKRLMQLLADLDSDRFQNRERAATELLRLGEQIEPALHKALAAKPSLEVARRLRGLLDQVESRALSAEQLHVMRAVEVLEHVGTVEAQVLLRSLAAGAPGDNLSREAKASLERLASRAKRQP